MKKRKTRSRSSPRGEYDFTDGVRGKYASRVQPKSRAVVLEPELARLFPDSRSVNRVLRLIAEIARKSLPK
jgi:hypothetical protein